MKTNDPKIISLPDVQRIEEEAAGWVMRLQGDNLSGAEIAAFKAWQSRSPKHKDIFSDISRFWDGLDFVEELADYAQNDAAIEPLKQDRAARRMKYFRRILTGGIAASIIAMVSISTFKFTAQMDTNLTASYETMVGEQETIDLPDGSQIILNTNSAVSITYSKQTRKIVLSRGEGFFDVEPDKDRPFSVNTHKGIVTAVGTAFSVRLTEEKLDVLVTEGRVALTSTSIKPTLDTPRPSEPLEALPVLEVSAGQAAVIDNGVEKISLVQPLALEKGVDWRDGELSFKGETLEQVIQDISRYTDMTIEISGDELRTQRIVAYYKVGDIDRLFEALNVMANVEVEQVSETHVKLYRAQ